MWPGHDADPSPPSSAVVMKEYSYTSTPPMGRTVCTEPQCLYKGALYLPLTFTTLNTNNQLTFITQLNFQTFAAQDLCLKGIN
jgi:hypothetical protein